MSRISDALYDLIIDTPDDRNNYFDYESRDSIILDGRFTLDELKKMVELMEDKNEGD
jgi:hypothetical protein